jgi:uncharacterized repeat protein (TIGR03943 family)
MGSHWYERLKVFILLGLGFYFGYLYLTGNIGDYINSENLGWLTFLGFVMFLVLGVSAYNNAFLRRQKEAQEANPLAAEESRPTDISANWNKALTIIVVALPLVLAIFIPSEPLDSDSVQNDVVGESQVNEDLISKWEEDLATNGGTVANQRVVTIQGKRNILDWVRAVASAKDYNEIYGQPVDVLGFVYRDSRFNDQQFMVTRFTIACCVADATAVGLTVEDEAANSFSTDTWVRVKGQFTFGDVDGQTLPVIVLDESNPEHGIFPANEPEQPYLYQ